MLYARQIAWWSATPKRREKVGKTERQVILATRAKQAQDKGDDLYYPPIPQEVGYLVEYLQELDYAEPGMGGPMRLSFQEIGAWAALNGVELRPWEVSTLRSMSDHFVRELVEAENHLRPPPWSPAPEQIDRKEIAARIKQVLRG